MLDNLQLWIFGAAALIDTVLLFALLERHNWRAVTVWMLALAIGVWTWHVGYFTRWLVNESVGPFADPVRWMSMFAMAFGLMTMPSAALHGTFRLLRHGQFQLGPKPDPRLTLCYAPLLLLVPMGQAIAAGPAKPFLELLAPYQAPYVVWLCLVSGFTSYGLWSTAKSSSNLALRRFYDMLAGSMLLTAGLTAVFIFSQDRFPSLSAALQSIVALTPMVPAILFAYFVMRFQLLPFILERTLVYGAVLMGAILFHQLLLRRLISSVEERYRLDLRVVEAGLVFTLILLYQPLRRRVADALESLLGSSDSRRSDRRRLAVQLAVRAGDPVSDLLQWFNAAMQRSFGADLSAGWLCNHEGQIIEKAGATDLLDDQQVRPMLRAMAQTELPFLTRYTASDPLIIEFLDRVRAGALLRFEHVEVSGLFLIGCRRWGQPPSDEDLHAMSLLVEQFGITLHNSRLLSVQVAAEQRLLQQEKLSTLGLVTSSLAHEIKNPLSSIKTIIRVLTEELGPESRYAEDLRMISGEIERLAASTSDLLSATRPQRTDQPPSPLVDVLSPTLRLLHFLALQREVTLDVKFPPEPIVLAVDQIGLREIIFNLISNAVDAAGAKGRVQFVCRRESDTLRFEVHDSGPGISMDQRKRLFEPFYTTKVSGTGLGLYIVARRVRELGGQIDCDCKPQQGTTFLLTLPCV